MIVEASLESVKARFPDLLDQVISDLRISTKKPDLQPEMCKIQYQFGINMKAYSIEDVLRIAIDPNSLPPPLHPYDRLFISLMIQKGSRTEYAALHPGLDSAPRDVIPDEVKGWFEARRGYYNMPLDPAGDEPKVAEDSPQPGM